MPSAVSHETLVRQLQMLQLIPRSPAQITVADLTRSLSELGFNVTSRTVQRDLNDIATVMPLECNNLSKPYGWKWARDAYSGPQSQDKKYYEFKMVSFSTAEQRCPVSSFKSVTFDLP